MDNSCRNDEAQSSSSMMVVEEDPHGPGHGSTTSTTADTDRGNANQSLPQQQQPTDDIDVVDNDDDDAINVPFYFESDHLALKGNDDYHMLLKTLAVLEAQRIKGFDDYEELIEIQKKAMQDPIEFVGKLQRREDLGIPARQRVAEVPDINWQRYSQAAGGSSMETAQDTKNIFQRQTRLKTGSNQEMSDFTEMKMQQSESGDSVFNDDGGPVMVRGRAFDPNSQSHTFNQLWTKEEQMKLEALLLRYPTEEVEMRRWAKIASALGTRTPVQVASRVQKYFISLQKAGLPVPGKIQLIRRSHVAKPKTRRTNPYSQFQMQQSTFYTSLTPTVYMNDDDPLTGYVNSAMSAIGMSHSYPNSTQCSDDETNGGSASDDECIPVELRGTQEYREMMRLKLLKKHRIQGMSDSQVIHEGYQCDHCQATPILGPRYHCVNCPASVSIDCCAECLDFLQPSQVHTSSHTMQVIASTGQDADDGRNSVYIDPDYTQFQTPTGDYNYLDPNYIPGYSS